MNHMDDTEAGVKISSGLYLIACGSLTPDSNFFMNVVNVRSDAIDKNMLTGAHGHARTRAHTCICARITLRNYIVRHLSLHMNCDFTSNIIFRN